jgi:hypothetical protein
MKKIVYWLPRIIALLYILFISIFALDVFSEPAWLTALIMHLIPSFILIVITWIAWKRELIGGFGFLLLGAVGTFYVHSFILMIPVFVTGILFLFHHWFSHTTKSL